MGNHLFHLIRVDWAMAFFAILILVEHDMGVVMDISDRVCVLEFGQKIAQGSPQEIQENPQVIRAYLGEDEKAYSRL